MAEEIIARDRVHGTIYEFRVGPTASGYEIQLRFRGGQWESASMGNYNTKEMALKNFVPRYRTLDFNELEAIHPIIQKARAEKLAKLAEESRQREMERRTEQIKMESRAKRVQAVNDEFKRVRFKQETTKRTGAEGSVLADITGPSINGLTIHLTTDDPKSRFRKWQVTHQASGFAVGPDFETQRDAKLYAYRLSSLVDFRQSAEALKKSGAPYGEISKRLRQDLYADLSDVKPQVQIGISRNDAKVFMRKPTPGISTRAATARFLNPNAGKGQAKQRIPEQDKQTRAQTVAPAVPKSEEDLALQKRWFRRPNRLDFEGIDTPNGSETRVRDRRFRPRM